MTTEDWTVLNEAVVLNALPTDLGNIYRSWVEGNPAKVDRLEELTEQVVQTFRAAYPLSMRDEALDTVSVSAYHHAVNLIIHSLGMEMGVQFAPEVYTLLSQANVWLRMAQGGSFWDDDVETVVGNASYREPDLREAPKERYI